DVGPARDAVDDAGDQLQLANLLQHRPSGPSCYIEAVLVDESLVVGRRSAEPYGSVGRRNKVPLSWTVTESVQVTENSAGCRVWPLGIGRQEGVTCVGVGMNDAPRQMPLDLVKLRLDLVAPLRKEGKEVVGA